MSEQPLPHEVYPSHDPRLDRLAQAAAQPVASAQAARPTAPAPIHASPDPHAIEVGKLWRKLIVGDAAKRATWPTLRQRSRPRPFLLQASSHQAIAAHHAAVHPRIVLAHIIALAIADRFGPAMP